MLFVIWIIAIVCGVLVGSQKNRPILGLVLSACFSFVGVVILLCIGKKEDPDAPKA